MKKILLEVFQEILFGIKFIFFDHIYAIFNPLPINPKGNKKPLVLISGFWGRTHSWKKFANYFSNLGHPVFPVSFGFQIGDINPMSKQLTQFINHHDLNDCILVCHSMGGILALKSYSDIEHRIHKIITLSTPFKGTKLSYFFTIFKSARQMLPNSNEIKQTIGNFKEYNKIISLNLLFDEIVHPGSSSYLHPDSDIKVNFGGHLNSFMNTKGIKCLERLINKCEE